MLAKVRLDYEDGAGSGLIMRDPVSLDLSGSVWLCSSPLGFGFRSGL